VAGFHERNKGEVSISFHCLPKAKGCSEFNQGVDEKF
jgi:hypothetical protein